MRKYNKQRKLSAEQLEKRDLMAGNVTANIVGDTLFIRGDSLANDVSLIHESGGKLVLAGNNTKVNGMAKPLPLPTGFRGRVDVHLGGDNDRFLMAHGRSYDEKWFQSLRIDMGTGTEEWVTLTTAKFKGDLNVNTGGGTAKVNLGHTQANGNVKVTTGNGNDFVSMGDVRYSGTTEIDTKGGDDRIGTGPSSGNYAQFKSLSIRTEKGNDYVVMDQLVADRFFADLGDGDDTIHFTESSRANLTQLEGGAGIDVFTISRDSYIKGLRASSITRR